MTEPITVSKKLSEMTVDELVQVSQALGHQVEKLRADRAHIKQLIDQKLRADGTAPGAVIDAGTA